MKRREFVMIAGAAALMMTTPGQVVAEQAEYVPGLVKKLLASGKTVFLDFNATWCVTCAAQGRVIDALREGNPAYDRAIVFVNVDWDTYKNAAITRNLNIPRRSTLVVLKGDKELGRVVAGTSKKVIKALMDTALAAAG